jgi:DNA (cytosine-5)-methyltransferase 1
MSVRELALTQSFPIDFIFEGNNSSAYRQIGNAVPVNLAFAIASIFPKEFKHYANNKTTSKAILQL